MAGQFEIGAALRDIRAAQTFRPGDRVIENRFGRRGTIMEAHYFGSRRAYTVQFAGRKDICTTDELRIDPAEVLFGWPRKAGDE